VALKLCEVNDVYIKLLMFIILLSDTLSFDKANGFETIPFTQIFICDFEFVTSREKIVIGMF
jgi:hypothetical protein